MSLYPTPTRLALLRAVDAGEVTRSWSLRMEPVDRRTGQRVNARAMFSTSCSARMAELARAGWVTYPPMRFGGGSVPWTLTDAGRAVLAEGSTDEHR